MATGAVVARILTQYSDKGSKAAQKDINKLGQKFDAFSRKATRAFGIAATAVSAFAIKIGKDAVEAAMADQKSQALLANSLRNTTGATAGAIASVEDYISKLQLQVGVADDELRPSLAKLAAVTGSVSVAQNLLGTALDVSAFAGVDLGTATNAITKALNGQFKSLQKLVPSLNKTTLKSKDLGKILAEVTKATSGSAATRAGTLEYKLAILRIRYSEILETLGYALLPVMERFANLIQTRILPQLEAWIATNKDKLVDGLSKAATGIVNLVTAGITFSTWVSDNIGTIKIFASIMGGLWAAGKVIAFAGAIKTLIGIFTALRTAAAAAGIATAFATGGASVVAATAALAAVGGAVAIYSGLNALGKPSTSTGPLGNYSMSTGTVPSTGVATPTANMGSFITNWNNANKGKSKTPTPTPTFADRSQPKVNVYIDNSKAVPKAIKVGNTKDK